MIDILTEIKENKKDIINHKKTITIIKELEDNRGTQTQMNKIIKTLKKQFLTD